MMKIFQGHNNKVIKSWCENPEQGAIDQAIELTRPITNRLELTFMLAFCRHASANTNIAIRAENRQIIESVQCVGDFTHNDFSPRRSN